MGGWLESCSIDMVDIGTVRYCVLFYPFYSWCCGLKMAGSYAKQELGNKIDERFLIQEFHAVPVLYAE